MGIGKRIREAREQKGWTQRELGTRVGITASAIANYEKELSHPKESVLYRLLEALEVDANYLFQDVYDLPASVVFSVTSVERTHIVKYRALDDDGRDMVDTVLNKEHARVLARRDLSHPTCITLPLFQDKVSAGLGNFVSNGTTEQLSIRLLPETSGSDYVVQVTGDSMTPTYHDGDLVLVHSQPEIAVGEIGLWIVNGDGYIKQRGEHSLISLNPIYAPIRIEEGDRIDCFGKVLRRLEQEWIL